MIYYTLEHDRELRDWECATSKEAEEKSQDWWSYRHEQENMRNCDTRTCEAFIVGISYDADDNPIEVSREPIDLVYEYYHGDLIEHGTYR